MIYNLTVHILFYFILLVQGSTSVLFPKPNPVFLNHITFITIIIHCIITKYYLILLPLLPYPLNIP